MKLKYFACIKHCRMKLHACICKYLSEYTYRNYCSNFRKAPIIQIQMYFQFQCFEFLEKISYTTIPSLTNSSNPLFSLSAASLQSLSINPPKEILKFPGHPHEVPGITTTPCL